MATLLSIASLVLAGKALAAHPGLGARQLASDGSNVTVASSLTLTPIVLNTTTTPTELVPKTNVTLSYGVNNTINVNVTLIVSSTILLENVHSLTTVDCEPDYVVLSFNSTDALNAAYDEWSVYDDLVFITNHLGDCDTELERGFFLATSFAIDDSSLVATIQKTNVTNIACKSLRPLPTSTTSLTELPPAHMRANFTGLPGHSTTLVPGTAKRDITIDTEAVNVSSVWELPEVTLFEDASYIKATANSGSLTVAVILDGYLDFDVWSFSLDELYVDITTTAAIDLALELAVTAPYNDTFSYSDGVEYYIVDVPGLLTFGPALSYAVGASIAADEALNIVLDVGAELTDATLHLDFVGDETAAGAWEPTYHANLTLSQEAVVEVTPFASVTVGLDFEILGGLLDLSGGLTPKVSFPVIASLEATEVVSAVDGQNVTVASVSGSGTCTNALQVVSDFEFTLDAFVTQFFEVELYSVTVPIADECYSWA